MAAIREIVSVDFDRSMTYQHGNSVLAEAISDLSIVGEMQPHRYVVVRVLLDLGFDPNQLDDEQVAVGIAAQWRQAIRKKHIAPSVTANDVLKWLLSLKLTENGSLRQQTLDLDKQLEKLQTDVEGLEHTINALIYKLYGLNANEIALIENE